MDLASDLRRYFQVIGALLRREEETRRQAPFESVANLLEPVMLITVLSLLFYFLGRRQISPLGGPPVLFYATGFFPLYLFIYVSRRMRGAIDAPKRRFPVEQRLDHILVHVIVRTIDYVLLGLLLFGGIYLLITPAAIPANLAPVVLAFLAIVGLGFGWGVLNLVLYKKSRFWAFFFPVISRGLILVSGIFFLPDFLLPDTRYVMSFNPMLHAVSLFRTGFYPQYPALILDPTYLGICAVLFVFVGFLVERITRRSEGM